MVKLKLQILIMLLVLPILPRVDAQTIREIPSSPWSQSYEHYRDKIKPMPSIEKSKCEQQLKDILNDIDTKNKCSTDEDCTLLYQPPFGIAVPILKKGSHETESRMKRFRQTCIDDSIHFVPHNELENLPVCCKNKCRVKTSLKK